MPVYPYDYFEKNEKYGHDIKKNSKKKKFSSSEYNFDIWSNEKFVDLRKKLFNKDRNHKPCNVCDVNGMLNGKDAFKKWESYFSKQIKNK